MAETLEQLNFRMTNMAFLFSQDSLQVRTFGANLENKLQLGLREIFGQLDDDQFLGIRRLLSHGYRAARSLVSTEAESAEYWGSLSVEIQKEFERVSHYFSAEQSAAVGAVVEIIEQLASQGTPPLAEKLHDLLDQGESIIFLENKQFTPHLKEWLAHTGLMNSAVVVNDIRSLTKVTLTSKNLVILAAPREINAPLLRTLIFGGFAPQITFLTPNWWVGTKLNVNSLEVFPGLNVGKEIKFNLEGPTYSGPLREAAEDNGPDLYRQREVSEIEYFEPGGSVVCRYLNLSGSLFLPIEEDAEKVSTLVLNQSGEYEIRRVDPFRELQAGDIIVELASSAESDFLWEQAAFALDDVYDAFEELRMRWLKILSDKKIQMGNRALEKELRASGVSTAHNLFYWLHDSRFTRPRSISDFKALLEYLGLDSEQLEKTMSLTKRFRSQLSLQGQKAREAMALQVTDDDWASVNAGELRAILLEEFGDAEFQLVKFESMGASTVNCVPTQVRKILKGSING